MVEKARMMPVACFAPPLTDAKIAEYQEMIDGCDNPNVKRAMQDCMTCVKAWWELPESQRKDVTKFSILHKGKRTEFAETPLEQEHVDQLWDVTPWDAECDGMDQLFDKLPVDSELRNAAYHLLWFCQELTRDREPLTRDRLPH